MAFGFKRTDRRESIGLGYVTSLHFKWKNYISYERMIFDNHYNVYRIKNNDDTNISPGNYVVISEETVSYTHLDVYKRQ